MNRLDAHLKAISGHEPPERRDGMKRLWLARCGECLESIAATALDLPAAFDEHRRVCTRKAR